MNLFNQIIRKRSSTNHDFTIKQKKETLIIHGTPHKAETLHHFEMQINILDF